MGKGEVGLTTKELTKTDRNGKLLGAVSPLANWASDTSNSLARGALEMTTKVHREAALPKFHKNSFVNLTEKHKPDVNEDAPAFGRKAVIYATCFVNYNNPDIGNSALSVLALNGVDTQVAYPSCCGMPQLEHGNIEEVAA